MNQPFLVPWMPPRESKPEDRTPQRVLIAFRVVEHATEKTSPQVHWNMAGGSEVVDGQELAPEEAEAFHTACKLITSYLKGEMELTKIEQQDRKNSGGDKSLLRCVQCFGNGHVAGTRCELCKGQGGLMVSPSRLES